MNTVQVQAEREIIYLVAHVRTPWSRADSYTLTGRWRVEVIHLTLTGKPINYFMSPDTYFSLTQLDACRARIGGIVHTHAARGVVDN